MREVIYLNKTYIEDDRFEDVDLMLISLLIASKTDKVLYDRISIRYLTSFLYDGQLSRSTYDSFVNSLWKLDDLGVIKDAEMLEGGIVKAKFCRLGLEKKEECLKIYLSDIIKLSSYTGNSRFLKVFRLYLAIMGGMSKPDGFPDIYNNKIYWEGSKALLHKTGLSKRTYGRYLGLLTDVHVFYIRRDYTNNRYPMCISRCCDLYLCRQFSLRLGNYMRSFKKGYDSRGVKIKKRKRRKKRRRKRKQESNDLRFSCFFIQLIYYRPSVLLYANQIPSFVY